MRQTGFLAASAAYALTNNFPKLTTVHQQAKRLERGLLEIGVDITVSAETCMVCSIPVPSKRWWDVWLKLEARSSTILLQLAPIMLKLQSVRRDFHNRCLLGVRV
jgi:hypothetical protein